MFEFVEDVALHRDNLLAYEFDGLVGDASQIGISVYETYVSELGELAQRVSYSLSVGFGTQWELNDLGEMVAQTVLEQTVTHYEYLSENTNLIAYTVTISQLGDDINTAYFSDLIDEIRSAGSLLQLSPDLINQWGGTIDSLAVTFFEYYEDTLGNVASRTGCFLNDIREGL